MKQWIQSGDGFLKKAKSAITSVMPANKSKVDNEANPASALNMMKRNAASASTPTKNQLRSFRQ